VTPGTLAEGLTWGEDGTLDELAWGEPAALEVDLAPPSNGAEEEDDAFGGLEVEAEAGLLEVEAGLVEVALLEVGTLDADLVEVDAGLLDEAWEEVAVEAWEADEDEDEDQPVRVLRYQLMGSSPKHSPTVTDLSFLFAKYLMIAGRKVSAVGWYGSWLRDRVPPAVWLPSYQLMLFCTPPMGSSAQS